MKTKAEWEDLWKEVKATSPDATRLPLFVWLSATEGDIGLELGRLDHWPEGVEAEEGVWRDYYTGEQLENYTKPWSSSNRDKEEGEAFNCIQFYTTKAETRTWVERQCYDGHIGCPCAYDSPPLIRLRGFCPDTDLEHSIYTVTQSAADPKKIIIVGFVSTQ